MPEYTIKDVIIDCDDPRLKDAVGKQIYSAVIPYDTVMFASGKIGNCKSETLVSINRNSDYPFRCEKSAYPCIIIVKDDPKPEYIPFSSAEEFVNAYTLVKEGFEYDTFEDNLSRCGMWLKTLDEPYAYILVTEIWQDGLVVSDNKITEFDGKFMNNITGWEEILDSYTFLDGTACGKLMEVDNG